MAGTVPKRTRRVNAWWEPTYNPDLADALSVGDWALEDNGALKRYFSPHRFAEQVEKRVTKRTFIETRFDSCDFSGEFAGISGGQVFKKCTFINCDFGTSSWSKVKFNGCRFEKCSFSQSTWKTVEFRSCHWSEIGISGNETDFIDVFISNSKKFIDSAYTNKDLEVLTLKKTNVGFQTLKLEETKATVARNIFNNHKLVGDDQTFYDAFSVYIMQYSLSRIKGAEWNCDNAKGRDLWKWRGILLFRKFEHYLNATFGLITAWGSSSARPMIGLLCTFIGFAFFYWKIFDDTLPAALAASFDITSIAGFTRTVTPEVHGLRYVAAAVNLVLSLIFYSAFFSVAISKISRVR